MASRVRPRDWSTRLKRAAEGANFITGAIGIAGLVGWLVAIPELRTLGADFPPISPGGAIALLAAAVGLEFVGRPHSRGAAYVPRVAAAVIALLATLTIVEELAHVSLGMDFDFVSIARAYGGALSPATAWTFLFVAAALALAPHQDARTQRAVRLLAVAIAGMGLIALVGLTFSLMRLYVAAPAVGVPLPTAFGFVLVSFSLVATGPDKRLVRFIERDTPGAVMTRQLLPAAFAVPLLLAWAQTFGQHTGLFDIVAGEGGLTVLMMMAYAALVLWVAKKLDEMNARRSLAQDQADAQREWLQVTLANIGDGVVATDRNAIVRFVNPTAAALTGWPADAAAGQPAASLFQFVDERTHDPIASPLDGALQERRPVIAAGEPALRDRNGQVHPVEVSAMPIQDGAGEVLGGVLVLRDAGVRRERERAMRNAYADLDRRVVERTAELERATAALRESTTLLQTLTTSTPDPIFAKDCDGRVLMVNPAALQAMGRDEKEVLGRNALEFARNVDEARRAMLNDERVMESGEPLVVEETLSNASEVRTFLVTKSPLRDAHGRIVGVVGVATDITERKEAQLELEELLLAETRLRGEAEQANRAKDEFLAIVSHELRSPLNALKGWSHVLSGSQMPEPALIARATQAIKRNVDHQARLIDDLLDTSRIISGKLILERRAVNLVETVHAALDLARAGAVAKGIELRFFSDHPALSTEGDQARLQQVVTNLLSNAIKFTPENGLIETSLRQVADRIELAVRDTGIGIAPDFLPYVFDRFSQADTSTTRRHGGLGIGLALVRHLVELHGGRARAYSLGPGRGSTFTVELPATRAVAFIPARLSASDDSGHAHGALTGVRVFAVDDDADARDVIELALAEAGADVRVFASGRDLATTLANASPADLPSILLLDLAMPDEDGFAVLARVRSIEAARTIPAIAVTAFTQVDTGRLSTAGFYDRLGKPIDPRRLVDLILAAAAPAAPPQPIESDRAM